MHLKMDCMVAIKIYNVIQKLYRQVKRNTGILLFLLLLQPYLQLQQLESQQLLSLQQLRVPQQ